MGILQTRHKAQQNFQIHTILFKRQAYLSCILKAHIAILWPEKKDNCWQHHLLFKPAQQISGPLQSPTVKSVKSKLWEKMPWSDLVGMSSHTTAREKISTQIKTISLYMVNYMYATSKTVVDFCLRSRVLGMSAFQQNSMRPHLKVYILAHRVCDCTTQHLSLIVGVNIFIISCSNQHSVRLFSNSF
jgi:hypothetical protein